MPAAKNAQPDASLSEQVVRYLIDYTRNNRLSSGSDVPSEGQVSLALNVSRGVVREAYRSLRSAGVLDVANGRSPRVGQLKPESVSQFFEHALYSDQATPSDVLDLRSAVEVRAAELAAVHRTDADAKQLVADATAMRESLDQRRRFTNADIRFHETLGRASGNPLFLVLGYALFESLALTIRAGFDVRSTRAERGRIAQIHEGIATAILRRNPTQARKLMTVHFEEAKAFLAPLPVVGSATPAPAKVAKAAAKAPKKATTRPKRVR